LQHDNLTIGKVVEPTLKLNAPLPKQQKTKNYVKKNDFEEDQKMEDKVERKSTTSTKQA
jgi:hypothetical protein